MYDSGFGRKAGEDGGIQRRFAVVTDSASGIPRELETGYDISVVPIPIHAGGITYREREDISVDEFYRLLEGQTVPRTSSPPPGDFLTVYRQLANRFREILSVHVSERGSATCQAARVAAESVTGARVTVYDSGSVSMGTGFLALEAARGAFEGLSLRQVVPRLDALRSKIRAFVAVPTLEYLRRSGRVTHGQAILGSVLSVKLVLEVKDGVLKVVEKVRKYEKALETVLELAALAAGDAPARVAVMHANCPQDAGRMAEKVKRRLNVRELIVGEVGASLAVHGGPGMVGIILHPL